MNVLAIDASAAICSVAIASGEQLYLKEKEVARSHSEYILPMINACLEESGLKLENIDLCVFGKGPGSFTGLRLVSAIVQGLAYSHGFKLMGISSMQACAQVIHEETQAQDIFICDDARMNEVYRGHYQLKQDCMELLFDEVCIAPSKVIEEVEESTEESLVFGSGLSVYSEFADCKNIHAYEPKALAPALIKLSQNSALVQIFSKPELAIPSYIRTPEYKKRNA